MRRFGIGLFCSAYLLFAAPVAAQLPGSPAPERQYVYRNWDNQGGLPQNTVNDLVKDAAGYLWAATEEGLVRFDGMEFVVKNEGNTPGLHSNAFNDLTLSATGLWASSRNTVLRIANNSVRPYDFRQHLEGDWIRCVEEDRSGRLWVGTNLGKLFWLRGDSVVACAGWKQGGQGAIEVLLAAGGEMLVGTTRGLFRLAANGQGPAAYPAFGGLHITSLAAGRQGELWVGTADEGLFRVGRDTVQFTDKDGMKDRFVSRVVVAPGGEPWIGTRSAGFQVYRKGRFVSPEQEKYAHIGIKSILFGSEETAWLGTTSSGLVQIKPAQVQMLPAAMGLSESIILPIYQHPDGEVWVGTAGKGISRILNGQRTHLSKATGLSSDLVFSVCGTEDYIFIGTSDGLDRFNRRSGRIDRRFTKADGLASNSVNTLFYDSRGRLWLTSRLGGVQVMPGNGAIERLPLPGELTASTFLGTHEDRRGNLWFGSRGAGVVRLDSGGKVTHFNRKSGFPADIVFSFFEDRAGGLWMATDKGLVGYWNNRFTVLDKDAGLRFNEIYRVMEDGSGHLWLSGNFGLQRVALAQVQRVRDAGKGQRLYVRLFNTVDGMANAETNGGIFPAGWKMQDGTLWFPTVQGIAVVDPRFVREERKPVNVLLQSVRYADREHTSFEGLKIPNDVSNIEIRYASIDFAKAADINYSYRLRGLDEHWVAAGNRRTAYFPHLPPGAYTFEVRAEQYGEWSPTAVLAFTVRPRFYQTLWFKALLAMGMLGAGLGLFGLQRKKARRKLAEQQNITRAQLAGQEKERQVIGTELHDNINQQLATAKLYLDIARSNEELRLSMVEKSEGVVNKVISEIRALCKSLIPPTLKDIGLTDALQELIGAYRAADSFAVRFHSTAPLDELEEDIQFSLFRITQELMNNIARHAQAKEVRVLIKPGRNNICMTVEDDGRGFDVSRTPKGVGFTNIANRLELYGGRLEVVSAPGAGCTVQVTIPLHTGTGLAGPGVFGKKWRAKSVQRQFWG